MKKSEKKDITIIVMKWWDDAKDTDSANIPRHKGIRLRNCRAMMYDTGNYVWLRSYDTLVAVWDKRNQRVLDVLRTVYGYTATSSQHIRKFYEWVCKQSSIQPSLDRTYEMK